MIVSLLLLLINIIIIDHFPLSCKINLKKLRELFSKTKTKNSFYLREKSLISSIEKVKAF